MVGSIRQQRGRWQLRVSAGTDPITGKRIVETESFDGSRRAAEKRLAEIVAKVERQGATTRALSVEKLIAEWIAEPRHSRSQREKTSTALAHIPGRVKSLRADKLTPRILDEMYRHLEKSEVKTASIRNVHGVISAAYGQACKWGWMDRNPARQASPPPEAETKIATPTSAEIAAISAMAQRQDHKLWYRIHLATGARPGEVLALRWSSIDVKAQQLSIDGSIERDLDRSRGRTKNRKIRRVVVDAQTMKMIVAWQKVQRERSLAAGEPLVADPYLLSHACDSSRPWRPDSAGQLFERHAERAKVAGYTLYDLRHHTASTLLAAGVDPITVAARLGHDPRTLLKVYAHVIAGRDAAAAAVMAEQII